MDPITAGLLVAGGSALISKVGPAIGDYVAQRSTQAQFAKSEAGKAQDAQMRKDIAALQSGKLGIGEAEKRAMLAGSMRAAQASTKSLEEDLRRQAAATGGFGRSGAQQQALGNIAATRQAGATQAQGQIDTLSQQQAQARRAQILQSLATRRAEDYQMAAARGQAIGGLVGGGIEGIGAAGQAIASQGIGTKVPGAVPGTAGTLAGAR
jgi:hypothetical protein